MGKKKNNAAKMPPFPPMVLPIPAPFFNGDQEEAKAKAKEFKASAKDAWEKSFDMRKSSADGAKEQFDQFFAYILDMQDGFIGTLPEQLPAIPGLPECPVSPKGIAKAAKEFEIMFNDYMVKQVEACVAFAFDAEQKAVEMVPAAPAEEQAEAAEGQAFEAAEENAE